MAKEMTPIEVEAFDYVQVLTGKDSIMYSTTQTSVRIATCNLVTVDALAEMGNRSRNQIINDALDFGLRLIEKQFSEEDKKKLIELTEKHDRRLRKKTALKGKEK